MRRGWGCLHAAPASIAAAACHPSRQLFVPQFRCRTHPAPPPPQATNYLLGKVAVQCLGPALLYLGMGLMLLNAGECRGPLQCFAVGACCWPSCSAR